MRKAIIKQALNISREKLATHPQYGYFMHYSFMIQDNKIISWSTNLSGEPPIHYGYHSRLGNLDFKPKLHSEIMVYKKGKGILKKNKAFEILNIRLNKSGEIRNCKPCYCCENLMFELGCKAIYYFCKGERILKLIW